MRAAQEGVKARKSPWKHIDNGLQHKKLCGAKNLEKSGLVGDNNTTFFHKVVNACNRRNLLTIVQVNGAILSEEYEITGGLCNAFHTLPSKMGNWRLSIISKCMQ